MQLKCILLTDVQKRFSELNQNLLFYHVFARDLKKKNSIDASLAIYDAQDSHCLSYPLLSISAVMWW